MDDYDKIIEKMFEQLENVDAPREDYERALVKLAFKADEMLEMLEMEKIDPDDYKEDL